MSTFFSNNLMLPLLIFFLITSFSPPHLLPSVQSAAVNVWPKPCQFSWPKPHHATLLSPTFKITSPPHPHLSSAVRRYHHLIITEHHRPLISPSVNFTPSSHPPLRSLHITVHDLLAPLHHGVNESYTLSIARENFLTTAKLTAQTAWGAMRGLETFSQMVWGRPSRVAVGIYIWDDPIFPHRGLLLDTSRNYYGVGDIMRTISAMSANKMNVFHWHITDSQSFPLVLPSEPELAAKGSYGPEMQYSPEDVKKIVEFGLDHGVRVIPEIDAPGSKWEDRLAAEPGTGQLNPLNPKTYQVFKNVISDVVKLFPEPFFHGGADEIAPGCWKTDPTIQSFLSNGGNLDEILEKFVNQTFPYMVSLNRTVIYWEDVLLDDHVKVESSVLAPEHTILQTWNNGLKNIKRIVDAGYRVIVSSSEYYYLDCGHGGFVGNDSQYDQSEPESDGGSWCAPFKTWQTIYNYDITYGLSEEKAKLVLGGEVALWSEQADPTVVDSRAWPRASAMAEALWSGKPGRDGEEEVCGGDG
ncbi:Beta-hexosaminidase [Melia azedarach]|uniref:Beta-hexosaminidase n=1 Tax=Melia azedarach TaxID=155640 RepID=A0ACC1YJW0_MELAZ|nr:Beta-hexosaminidase [Melia azedarach]